MFYSDNINQIIKDIIITRIDGAKIQPDADRKYNFSPIYES